LRIRNQSRHSERTVRTKRSATPFACGTRNGVRTIRVPSLRNTALPGRRSTCVGSRVHPDDPQRSERDIGIERGGLAPDVSSMMAVPVVRAGSARAVEVVNGTGRPRHQVGDHPRPGRGGADLRFPPGGTLRGFRRRRLIAAAVTRESGSDCNREPLRPRPRAPGRLWKRRATRMPPAMG
jgi:hypothetical protein